MYDDKDMRYKQEQGRQLLDHCSQNVDTEAAPPSEDARIEQLLEMFRVAGPETADLMFALCETTFGKMEHRRKRSKK